MIMGDNVIRSKSFDFAVMIINTYKQITTEHREFVLAKQMLRSGTSVGANVREAINAESKPDFIHKLSIAQKECDETIYWLELLKITGYLADDEIEMRATELLRIIRSIIISSKKNS